MTRLREVSVEEFPAPQADSQPASPASVQLLLLALKTLSQRTIVAIAAIKGMILAGTVFWLALQVVDNPTPTKLTGLGIYAGFILIVGYMDLRRK